jgi:tetratricopeptide (TPR) repeat protein
MALIHKITLCFFLMFAVSTYAQTYPKYTTSKGKATATTKKEKPAEPAVKPKPAEKPAEEPKEQPIEEPPAISPSFNDLLTKARHLHKEKKYEEAAKAYTEALAVSPDEWKHLVLQFRGYAYFGIRDYDKAINDCTAAIEKTKVPNKLALGHLSYLRAIAYKARNKEGDLERACADYKVARITGHVTGEHSPGFNNCE